MARDGYPMYLAARILTRDMEPKVECRYFYCSRFALRIPCFYIMEREEILDQICLGGIEVTLGKLLRRGGLTEEEVKNVAAHLGQENMLDGVIPYRELGKYRKMLEHTEMFWKYVFSHAKKSYENTAAYLIQEGMLDPVRFAMADSGWTGSMQKTLRKLLESLNYRGRLQGFYYGLYYIPENSDPGDYHAYYFEPDGNIRRKVYFSNCFFECVFSSPEGMCTGYKKTGERILPVKEDVQGNNRKIVQTVLNAVAGRALADAEELPSLMSGWHLPDAGEAQKKLARLMGKPDRTEAEIFGNMSFTDDVLDAGQTLAAPLTEDEIRENRFFSRSLSMAGLKKAPVHESAWMEGSILLCGRHVQRHLLHNRLYKYALYYRKQILERRKQ